MHRGHALLFLAGVAGYLTAAGGGCTTQCRGPGCEASYAGGTLAIVDAAPSSVPIDAWADAAGRYEGDDDDGTSFVASVEAGTILLGQPDAGRVIPLAPVTEPTAIPTDPPAFVGLGIRFGASVLTLPTATGFDLFVGAPEDLFARGAVYVFRDAHAGVRPAEAADVLLLSEAPAGRFGTRLFRCADLDGDGLDDVAVTTPWFSDPDAAAPPLAGSVTLILSAELATAAPAGDVSVVPASSVGRTWWGAEEGESAGESVLCDEDVDGDGAVDLVVGAPYADVAVGRIYLLHTGALLPPGDLSLDVAAHRTIEGTSEEWLGTSLARMVIDDVPILAVGAAGYGGGEGRVLLLPRAELSANPLTVTVAPELTADPDVNQVHLGRFTGVADGDGDGLDDLVVGAPDYGTGTDLVDMGRVWVFLGANRNRWGATGPTTDLADLEITGTEPFQRVGQDVTLADLDADGDDEILLPTRSALP